MGSVKDLAKLFWMLNWEDKTRARLKKAGDSVGDDGWKVTRTATGYLVHTDDYPAIGSEATEETKDLWQAMDNYSWLVRGKDSPYPEDELRRFKMVPKKPPPAPVVMEKPKPAPVKEAPKPAPAKENPELERLRKENEELRERLAMAQDGRSGSGYR